MNKKTVSVIAIVIFLFIGAAIYYFFFADKGSLFLMSRENRAIIESKIIQRQNNKDYTCRIDSDCAMDGCSGARTKEYWDTHPSRNPCASYMNYTSACIKNVCVEVPR